MRLTWLGIQSSYSHSSLALPLLANACRDIPGLSWRLVNGILGDDPFDLARRVVETSPDVVCASLYLFNRQLTGDVLSRIKCLRPAVRLLGGGPECLGEGAVDVMLAMPWLDAVCRGEGEDAFPALLKDLLAGRPLQAMPCTVVREEDGCLADGGGTGVALGWEDAPLPCDSPMFDFSRPFAQVETARGCPMGCTYCTSCRTPVRFRELESVRRELKTLHDHGVREIRLLDRTFNQPDGRGAALLKMFREEYGDMRFHVEIHPGVLGPLVRQELERMPKGLMHIESGIQCLNPDVLKAVGRSPDIDSALEGLRFLVGNPSFETHCDLLTGLPEQRLADVIADTERLVDIGPAEIQMEALKMLPGTVLRHEAEQRGCRFCAQPPYDVMATPTLSHAEMARCRVLSKVLDRFYNAPALQPVFKTAAKEIPHWVEMLLQWAETSHWTDQPMGLRKRFECLETMMADLQAPETADALAIAWMTEAFPTSHGPGRRARLVTAIPEESICVFGEKSSQTHPTSRLWRLPLQHGESYFVYDRAIAPNHAIAMFVDNPHLPSKHQLI